MTTSLLTTSHTKKYALTHFARYSLVLVLGSGIVMGHRHRKHRCFSYRCFGDIDVFLRCFEIDVSVFCHRSLVTFNFFFVSA